MIILRQNPAYYWSDCNYLVVCGDVPDYSLSMTLPEKRGEKLAQQHAGRFRIVGYNEVRAKATDVAEAILRRYGGADRQVVIAPILGGGGLPARLVVDALLPFNMVKAVVPCQIRRYSGLGSGGETELLVPLSQERVRGEIVIGVDDLVDEGQTLVAFRRHAIERGASEVETAVIYAKPHSVFVPTFCAEGGVAQWLVLPGEEHTFMSEVAREDAELKALENEELKLYFETLGLDQRIVSDWLRLQ